MRDRTDSGFTIVELLVVTLIGAMVLGLGAVSLRHYLRTKALQGAFDTTVTELRSAQQRTSSEGYPLAYGIRFPKNGTRWDLVRYNASTGACSVVQSHPLTNGVRVSSTGTDFPESAAATACRNAAPNATAAHEVALFFARGTATAGTVTFELTGTTSTRLISVNAATGRVSS